MIRLVNKIQKLWQATPETDPGGVFYVVEYCNGNFFNNGLDMGVGGSQNILLQKRKKYLNWPLGVR